MNSEHSVTQYLEGLKRGSQESAQKIWERFISRLIRLADQKLKASPRKDVCEDDVVQQAFAEFFAQVQQGRFPKLDDRDDLWQVLAMLVDRRAKDQIRKLNTQKSGGGRVHTESIFLTDDEQAGLPGIDNVPGKLPTPEMAAELTELYRKRLESLPDDEDRQIAVLKLKGYTNQQIADQLQSSSRTIERRLGNIRSIWINSSDHEPG